MTSAVSGAELLAHPRWNKDAAFTDDERDVYGLRGLLPYRIATLDQQVAVELEHLRRKPDNLERYIGLAALQDRNETLFHRLLFQHLEELAPIVYTPTVGEACVQFSHIMRRPRGLWITPADSGRMDQLLRNARLPNVRLIVATDNERILGLGDLGAGGMGIPIGKLALYTAGAGVHPGQTLAVSLDCGTDNESLLTDEFYLGYPKPRLRGAEYDGFIEEFVEAVIAVYPHAVLQWEDFKQHNALRLLDRYRHRLASFNDDVQGTAAVVVAGILAALRQRGEPLAAQRVVLVGAGAAGIGIVRLLEVVLREEQAARDSRHCLIMLDSQGLVFEGRDQLDDDKRPFALPRNELMEYGFASAARYDLDSVVEQVAPTILVGTTGVAGTFGETAIRKMAARIPTPIVLPLSNPTSKAEATPSDILAWSDGHAIVATGSPFAPVFVDGRARLIGQANNVFIFPGVGLAAIVSRTREITDRMFLAAATTLAAMTPGDRLAAGALYPRLNELRTISRAVAIAVAREARDAGLAPIRTDEQIEAAVDAQMWTPEYGGL